VLGAVAAAIALGGVGYAILKLGKQLPLKPMLITGAGVLLLLSVAFVGNAVRSLQSADLLAATPVSWPAAAGVPRRADRIHPTSQGLVVQAALLGVYVLGAVYVFAWQPTAAAPGGETATRERLGDAARHPVGSTSAAPSRRPSRSPSTRSSCAPTPSCDDARRRGRRHRGRRGGAARAARRPRGRTATASSSSPTRRRRR
jgi:hypothetical protein